MREADKEKLKVTPYNVITETTLWNQFKGKLAAKGITIKKFFADVINEFVNAKD